MPKLVDVDRTKKARGRSRKYDLTPWLNQSLESGQGVYFTAEELMSEYSVKGQAAGSAARKDAELMTEARSDGQTVKVWVRLHDRDAEHPDGEFKDNQGNTLQDLELQAYLATDGQVNAPDASSDTEAVEAEAEPENAEEGGRKRR